MATNSSDHTEESSEAVCIGNNIKSLRICSHVPFFFTFKGIFTASGGEKDQRTIKKNKTKQI